MDLITLARLNKLKKNGGAGYSEGGGSLTWDGNSEGKEVYDGMVRVSDKACDPDAIKKICYYDTLSDCIGEEDAIFVDGFGDGSCFMTPTGLATIVTTPLENEGILIPIGIYFMEWDEDCTRLVLSVTFAETIHTIDPKYLPGVCLPVVELETEVFAVDAGTYTFSDADGAKLSEALATGMPIVAVTDGCAVVVHCAPAGSMFVTSFAGMNFSFQTYGSAWRAIVTEA